jgi:hypothetical protein
LKEYWWCFYCGPEAEIMLYSPRVIETLPQKGFRFVCKNCIAKGWLSDKEAPIRLTEEEFLRKSKEGFDK